MILLPGWLIVGLALSWIPVMIGTRKGDPMWIWFLFGIVALPLAILFALIERPISERLAEGGSGY